VANDVTQQLHVGPKGTASFVENILIRNTPNSSRTGLGNDRHSHPPSKSWLDLGLRRLLEHSSYSSLNAPRRIFWFFTEKCSVKSS